MALHILLPFFVLYRVGQCSYYTVGGWESPSELMNASMANERCQKSWRNGFCSHSLLASVHSKDEFDSANTQCLTLVKYNFSYPHISKFQEFKQTTGNQA